MTGAIPILALWVHATLIDATLVAYDAWIEPPRPGGPGPVLRRDPADRPGLRRSRRRSIPPDLDAFEAYLAAQLGPDGPIRVTPTARELARTILAPPLGPLHPLLGRSARADLRLDPVAVGRAPAAGDPRRLRARPGARAGGSSRPGSWPGSGPGARSCRGAGGRCPRHWPPTPGSRGPIRPWRGPPGTLHRMTTRAVLAIDLGTTQAKAGLVTLDGRLLALGASRLPDRRPTAGPGAAEQDPADWWSAIRTMTGRAPRRRRPGRRRGDLRGRPGAHPRRRRRGRRPLGPAMTWMDTRAAVEEIGAGRGDRRVRLGPGHPAQGSLGGAPPTRRRRRRPAGTSRAGNGSPSACPGSPPRPTCRAGVHPDLDRAAGDRAAGRARPAAGPVRRRFSDRSLPGPRPSSGCPPGSRWSRGWPTPTRASSGRACSSRRRDRHRRDERRVRRLHRSAGGDPGRLRRRGPDPRTLVPGRRDERDRQGARLAPRAGPRPGAGRDHRRSWPRRSTPDPAADGLVFLPYLAGERSPIWDPAARGAFVGSHPAPRPDAPGPGGPRGGEPGPPPRRRADRRRRAAGP